MITHNFGFLAEALEYYSANLFFVDNDLLIQAISEPVRFTENQTVLLVSELLIRYYLKPSENIKKALCAFLSDEIFNYFDNACNTTQKNQTIPETLLPINPGVPLIGKIQQKAHRHLEELLNKNESHNKTDGFILAVSSSEGEGLIIPFELIKCEPDEISVVDLEEKTIPQWSESLKKLNLPQPYKVILRFHSSSSQLKVQDYTGDSLQLPLYMAYLHKIKKVPQYNHLRLFFSGQIEKSREISGVEIKGKFNAISERFCNPEFVCCSYDRSESESNSSIHLLTPGSLLERVQEDVISIIEQKELALFEIEYIKERLGKYDNITKKDLENRWEGMIQKLSNLLSNVTRSVNPDVYLSLLVCLSFAYCHSGQTNKARKYNQKAVEFAKQENCNDSLLLLKIHEMIILQDEEKFEEITNLNIDLKELLNSCKNDDLMMRYYGSRGQTIMHGAVMGVSKYDSQEGLHHIEQAIKFACRLPVSDNSREEIARDLNYKHLWYALFKPGSEEEADVYKEASKYSLGLKEDSKKMNLDFLAYQRGKAIYRRILKNEEMFHVDTADEMCLPYIEKALSWVNALAKKYLGAYYCFTQDYDKARSEFDDALGLLKDTPETLIQYIRMTIAAEAFRSFAPKDGIIANGYKNIAKEIFKQNNNFDRFPSSAAWNAYIHNDSEENVDFPGLKYYY